MSAERPSTLQLTYEDYILIPDDGQRREIIDGEVFAAPLDVILSDTHIVQPDVLFVSEDRSSIITERGIEGAPDFAMSLSDVAVD